MGTKSNSKEAGNEYKFLIAGEWRTSDKKVDVLSPYTQKAFATIYLANAKDVEDAISSATHAFEETKKLPSYTRSNICRYISNKLKERRQEFGEIISMENGKAIKDALAEVDRAIVTFSTASEEANRMPGEVLPLDIAKYGENRLGIWKRFPIGPVAGIAPFNFPLNLVCHKVAPALATGNPIILRPSTTTPLSALKLAEIILETEWPKNAISFFPSDRETARPLVEDNRIKLITFTGSPPVGWDIKKRAGKKKVTLELGGNAGIIIDETANIDYAAKRCTTSAFALSGQSCVKVQRIFIHEKVYETFMQKFIEETKKLKLGDPLDPNTDLGPMVDESNAKRIESWVNDAVKDGAKLLIGGKRNGTFYEPTILTKVPKKCDVVRKEAFAPVVVVEKVKDFEQGIREVNDSDFGLQTGIFIKDVNKAIKAYQELDVGGVIVNDVSSYRVDPMPYGGVKDSGFGREGIKFAMEEMTEIKMLVINLTE